MDCSVPLLLLLLLVVVGMSADAADWYTCLPGVEPSPGVSLPRGDISLEVGGPPRPLSCHLNPEHEYYRALGLRAGHLSFWTSGGRTLNATVLNDTSIRQVFHYYVYHIIFFRK
jgi:hypothetical protein